MVMDRHDGLPDGWTPAQKAEARRRLEGWQSTAVRADTQVLTHPSTASDCIPTVTDAGTG